MDTDIIDSFDTDLIVDSPDPEVPEFNIPSDFYDSLLTRLDNIESVLISSNDVPVSVDSSDLSLTAFQFSVLLCLLLIFFNLRSR